MTGIETVIQGYQRMFGEAAGKAICAEQTAVVLSERHKRRPDSSRLAARGAGGSVGCQLDAVSLALMVDGPISGKR